MVQLSNHNAEIAVIGPCAFQGRVGSLSFAACEMIARNFPVCVIPTEPHLRQQESIRLPNRRVLPVCRQPERIKASFFCDVLWRGVADRNYDLAPAGSLKYAFLVHDSDQLPPRWTELLNQHFHLVVATNRQLVEVARNSGVTTPIACLPVPQNLEPLLAEPLSRRDRSRVRFGSIIAGHPPSSVVTLLEAFLETYGEHNDVELMLHFHAANGRIYNDVIALATDVPNIVMAHGPLSDRRKRRLIQSFDIFVNCSREDGDAREALAYGKSLILSDVGGHKDLAGLPGVTLVPAQLAVPARHSEIDNGVFGQQFLVRKDAMKAALKQGLAHVRSGDTGAYARRVGSRNFSFGALSTPFGALLNPDIMAFRRRPMPPTVAIPDRFQKAVGANLGRRAERLSTERHQVCAAYDAGFFSIFNAFMSHLVWQQQEERCHAVYPDWDIDRLIERVGNRPVRSFCYGQPGDGNLWLKLFEPLFGSTDSEMSDPEFLYCHATEPADRHNQAREPFMTHINAYLLYKTRDFQAWRRHYHRVFQQHVRLREPLREEIDDFARNRLNRRLMIAVHVRHPSHTVEQPGAVIAHEKAYIAAVYDVVRARGLDRAAPDWGVFLATDQDRVVNRFHAEFGSRLACFPDVRRTQLYEDAAFDALSPEQQNQEGYQLQHLVSADRNNWSVRMAWEVVRDAFAMARCHVLLHVVSNVSTAVSYMNPELQMIFCEA